MGTYVRILAPVLVAALVAAACGGGGGVALPTPTPAGVVHLVAPQDYSGNTWQASNPGTSAYLAGIDVEAFTETTRDYTVSATAAQRAVTPAGAVILRPGQSGAVGPARPVSPQETDAMYVAIRRGPIPGPSRVRGQRVLAGYTGGQSREFWVCDRPFNQCNAGNQARITATVVAATAKSAIFVDNNDLSRVSQTLAQALAQGADRFWAIITGNLGLPENPFNPDGTGQIAYLFTSKVGQIDPNLAGFFFPVDLYRDADTVQWLNIHSNELNMLYLHAGYAAESWMPSTLAHEFSHLVHYSRRVFVHSAPFDPPYFVEGLAQVMEDLAGYGYNGGGSPRSFVRLFLSESDRVSLWRWGDPPADLRSYYGGAYLFTRYLMDRFGGETLSRIINSTLDTPAAVESISREAYGTTFAGTALAIVNSHEGLGVQDARFRYTSIHVSLAGPMKFLSPGAQQTTPMNWRFIYGQPGGPSVRVVITVGTSKPYAGVVIR